MRSTAAAGTRSTTTRLDRLDLADGQLSIDTFNADISGTDNGPIENLILQTPPEGDWTVETKMTAPLAKNWQLAGLMLYEDDDHYVKYDVVADNATGAPPVRRVELRYEDGGNLTGPGVADLPPPASATDTWWLRLTKTGNTYTGAISADGETWTQTPGSVTVELENPGIGVMAIGPQQVTPITVDFDYVRLVTEAENSAPVIGEATATPESGTAPLEVDFDVTATDADEDELTYSWDLDGDGEADSTQQSPTHTYTEPGTYEAEVTVSDGEATDTATVTVEVTADPSAPQVEAFSDVTAGEAPLEVRFTSTGLDPEGLPISYRWDFGNGDSAFARNARYTYAEPGTYTATVTVTDREGKTASDSIEITVEETVNDAPTVTAAADVTTGPAPLRVAFEAVGADEEDRPADLEYEWDFGDESSAFGRSPVHRYTAPGDVHGDGDGHRQRRRDRDRHGRDRGHQHGADRRGRGVAADRHGAAQGHVHLAGPRRRRRTAHVRVGLRRRRHGHEPQRVAHLHAGRLVHRRGDGHRPPRGDGHGRGGRDREQPARQRGADRPRGGRPEVRDGAAARPLQLRGQRSRSRPAELRVGLRRRREGRRAVRGAHVPCGRELHGDADGQGPGRAHGDRVGRGDGRGGPQRRDGRRGR